MGEKLVSTKKLTGKPVVDEKRGKRIGKVRRFVFHPTEKRCIGILVKRPDAALMFHRKDLFVALDGYHADGEGNLVVHDDPEATERGAIKALGVNWERCVIWVGMPVMTTSGEVLGCVDAVTFDAVTGVVSDLTTENGVASDAILGRRSIPASYIKGFKRGQGAALVSSGDYQGEDPGELVERGAIVVSDAAAELPVQGGASAAAGKATALVADKAKKGAEGAMAGVAKAKRAVEGRIEEAKPEMRKLAGKADKAFESGTFAVGKQLGKASGMFAAFKEEFDKAARGEDEDD